LQLLYSTNVNGRRFYVIVADGERGPFSHDELREALNAREITLRDQVRSGMGTALGTVSEVLARSSSAAPPLIGQTTDGLPPVRVFRPLPLIILGVSVVPAVMLLVLLRGRSGEVAPVNQPEPTLAPLAANPTIPVPPPITHPTPPRSAPTPPSSGSPTLPAIKTDVTTKLVIVRPEADGRLMLRADAAQLSGPDMTIASTAAGSSLNGWKVGISRATWLVQFVNPGTYRVVARYACPDKLAGSEVEIAIGPQRRLRHVVKGTGTLASEKDVTVGEFTFQVGGNRYVTVEPITMKGQDLWRLFSLSIIPE
jgi:hypothetical protein